MNAFIKPTRVKIVTTILLLVLFIFWKNAIAITPLPDVCLPKIGEPLITPTPAPFSISQTITDLKNASCLGNYSPGDPSAKAANTIISISGILMTVLPFIIVSYLLTCIAIFLLTKLKKQKKNTAKPKS